MGRGAPHTTSLALAGVLVLLGGCSSDGGSGAGPMSSPGSTRPSETSSPSSATLQATIEVGADPIGIASGEATETGPELARIDVATQEVVAESTVAENGLINANQVMVFEDGSLWLPILDDGVVLRVAPPATIAE